jgi:hypothetical protein
MAHIKPRYIKSDNFEGELTVDDYGIFLNGGDLKHVSRFWEAAVAQAQILDLAHEHAIAASDAATNDPDPEAAGMAYERHEVLQLSDTYLVTANIFCLLAAFFEFAILEVYSLVFSAPPSVQRPELVQHILDPLSQRGIVTEVPSEFRDHVLDNRDAVRNAFAHGRWTQLRDATEPIDLHGAFIGIITYFGAVEENLHAKGFNP